MLSIFASAITPDIITLMEWGYTKLADKELPDCGTVGLIV